MVVFRRSCVSIHALTALSYDMSPFAPRRGFEASCADLTRVGWIAGLLPSALSPEYFKGELTPAHTLKVSDFFFFVFVVSRGVYYFEVRSKMFLANTSCFTLFLAKKYQCMTAVPSPFPMCFVPRPFKHNDCLPELTKHCHHKKYGCTPHR